MKKRIYWVGRTHALSTLKGDESFIHLVSQAVSHILVAFKTMLRPEVPFWSKYWLGRAVGNVKLAFGRNKAKSASETNR